MSETLVRRPTWMDDPNVTITSATPTAQPTPPAAPAAQPTQDPNVTITAAPAAQATPPAQQVQDPNVTITSPPGALSQVIVPGQSATPAQPEPEGIVPSLWSGIRDAYTEGQRLGAGQAFDPSQPLPPATERTTGGNIAYGLAHAAPTLAMTALGGAAGTATGGPVGGIAGAGIAGGLSSAAQTLIPAYDAALRQGLDHDAAVDQAIKMSVAQGAIGGVTGLIMGAPIFKSAISSFLFNTVAVNPTAGLVNRGIVTPKITGQEPTADELLAGVGQDIVGGAVTHGAIKGGQMLGPKIAGMFPGRGRTSTVTPDPATGVPTITVRPEPEPTTGLLPAPEPNAGTGTPPGTPPAVGTDQAGTPPGTGTRAGTGAPDPATLVQTATHDPLTGNPYPVEEQLKRLNQGITVAQAAVDAPPGTHPPEVVAGAKAWIAAATDTLNKLAAAPPGDAAASGAATTQAGSVTTPGAQPQPQPQTPTPTPPSSSAPGTQTQAPAPTPPLTTPTPQPEPAAPVTPAPGSTTAGSDASSTTTVTPPSPVPSASPGDTAAPPVPAAPAAGATGAGPVSGGTSTPTPAPAAQPTGGDSGLTPPVTPPSTGAGTPTPTPTPTPAPTVTPTPTPPPVPTATAKRPVTKDELTALDKRVQQAQQVVNRVQRDPSASPQALTAAQDKLTQAQTARANAEGPPTKATYVKNKPPGHDAQHQAAVDAHTAAINQRIHDEGTTPTPDKKGLDRLLKLDNTSITTGVDSQGNTWTGTGHAMVRGGALDKPVTAAARKGVKSRTVPSAALDNVTRPDPNAKYEPVTWHRQVTDSEGKTLVLGTLPDGKHVTLQKPIYDTLHAAAGPGGTVVAAPGAKSDMRVFARNAKGETMGVGQPMRVDQAVAKVWAGAPSTAPAPTKAPATPAPAPGSPAETLARLDAEGAPDEAYRAALSTLSKDPLKPGETWRSRLEKWAQDEAKAKAKAKGETKDLADLAGDTLPAAEDKAEPDPKHFTSPNEYDGGYGDIEDKDIPASARPVPEGEEDHGPEGGVGAEEEEPAEVTDDTANKLRETIALLSKAPPTKSNRLKLQDARVQLQRRLARIAATRAAWKPKHVTKVAGAPRTFHDFKFANGTSVFHGAFTDAGLKPELWVNKPIAEQNEVLTKQVKAKFGFRDVTWTKSADPKQVNDQLLDTYRAGQDMANALALPYTALGVNGRIALRLEGKGRKYYGVYEPGTMTVGIVGQAQSFMHEWFHALDHMLSDALVAHPNRRSLMSMNARDNDLVPGQHDVMASFAKLVNVMFYDDQDLALQMLGLENTAQKTNPAGQPTKAAQEAQAQLERLAAGASRLRIKPSVFRTSAHGLPNPQYWASAHEMLARAGEAWASRQARNAGVSPRGLVMHDEAYMLRTDPRIGATFPHGDERLKIFDAITKLFEDIRHAAIFPGGVGAKSADMGMSDPSTWGRQNPNHNAAANDIADIVRATMTGFRDMRVNFKNSLLSDPSRPVRTIPKRKFDLFYEHTFSSVGMMDVIIAHAKKHAPAGAPYLQELRDKLMDDPGSGRHVEEVFEARSRRRSRRTIKAFTDALADHGINAERMTVEQGRMLRHVLTTAEDTYPLDASMTGPDRRVPIPENIQKAAEKIRHLLNLEFDYNRESGLEVLYAMSGWFPRMFDDIAISNNPDQFIAAATEMHKFIFDQDVGETDPDPAKMLAYWRELPKFDKDNTAPKALVDAMTRLRKVMRRLDQVTAELAASSNDPALTAERDTLTQEAADIADQHSPTLGTLVGERAAIDWHTRVLAGGPTDFDTRGPSARFTRHRELPPEADRIMRDFLITDPKLAIPKYLEASARKSAFAQQFGAENNLIDRNIDLAAAGGVPGEDLATFRNLIEMVTGRTRNTYSRNLIRSTNYLAALGSVIMLPKVAWSSVHEPLAAALSTRDFKYALGIFARQFKGIVSRSTRREVADLADYLGITTSVLYESVMSSWTVDYRDTPTTARFMSAFFRMIGMTGLVNAQRRAGMAAGTYFLRRLANRASAPMGKLNKAGQEANTRQANRRDDAQRLLRELGVPDAQHTDLAAWLNSFDGIPSPAQLKADPMGDVYGTAVTRLVNRTNQEPMRVQKPMRSADPVGKLTFALMPFLYSFWQNVMEAATHRIGHAYQRQLTRSQEQTAAGGGGGKFTNKGRALAAGANEGGFALMAATLLTLGALLMKILYNLLWNTDQWDKHEKKGDLEPWLVAQAISATGMSGPVDALVQAFEHIRYEADLANLAQGATVSTMLTNARNLLMPYTSEGGTGNQARYDQFVAMQKLILQPLLQLGLTKVSDMFPGGIPAKLAMIAAWEVQSSRRTRDWADAVIGPRGTKDPEAEVSGGGLDIPEIPGTEGIPDPMSGGATEKEAPAPPSGLQSLFVSLADDIILPVARASPPMMKAAAGLTVGAYAAWDWWVDASKFRNAPPPEPKP